MKRDSIIKPCEVVCKDRKCAGFLYFRNERVVVLLNNFLTSIDLGPLSSVKKSHSELESLILVLPMSEVETVSVFDEKDQ